MTIRRDIRITKLHPLNEPALTAAFEIISSALGTGAYSLSDLRDHAGGTRGVRAALLGAWFPATQSRLVAAGTVELLGDDLSYYARFGTHALGRLSEYRCGSLSSLAVAADFRGQGIGRVVLAAQTEWLKNQGAELLVAVSWMSGRPHPSHLMFEKAGFEFLGEAENVYFEDSLKYGLRCPICNGLCRCRGRLYVRPVDSLAAVPYSRLRLEN